MHKAMKAIVQSCDRYHTMTEHMLVKYEQLWPSNPFTFRIPWNKKKPQNIRDKFKTKIDLIHTDIKFKETFNSLTQDLDDNEWVYWCIDDKYPIKLDEEKGNQVLNFVESINDPKIINVCFHFVRGIENSANCIQREGSGMEVRFEGLRFIEHKSFVNNWLHQFFRVKALREFWGHINEPSLYKALAMDNDVQPLNGISLTLDHNICVYGESTFKGFVTQNCKTSCEKFNIEVPDYFVGEKLHRIII
jgi:hypothetical protein